jgi:hypothetical protein
LLVRVNSTRGCDVDCVEGEKGQGIHESNGYFEHVVAQREVAKTIPCPEGPLAHAALGVMEVFLRVFVEARHCGLYE